MMEALCGTCRASLDPECCPMICESCVDSVKLETPLTISYRRSRHETRADGRPPVLFVTAPGVSARGVACAGCTTPLTDETATFSCVYCTERARELHARHVRSEARRQRLRRFELAATIAFLVIFALGLMACPAHSGELPPCRTVTASTPACLDPSCAKSDPLDDCLAWNPSAGATWYEVTAEHLTPSGARATVPTTSTRLRVVGGPLIGQNGTGRVRVYACNDFGCSPASVEAATFDGVLVELHHTNCRTLAVPPFYTCDGCEARACPDCWTFTRWPVCP